MFAVIKTGGKQYKVAKDSILEVEKLDAEAGDTVNFEEVLMLGGDSPVVGAPLIDGAAVAAEVLEQKRGEKVINYVKRRRKHSSQRRKGHRQYLTVVKITEIIASGGAKPAKKAAKKADAKDAGASKAADRKATDKKAADNKSAASADKKPTAKKAADKSDAKDAKAADKPTAKKAKADEGASADNFVAPSNLLKSAKGEPDDLKKISGVAGVLEAKLHDLGVFHFWQIAEWKQADIDYVNDHLSFKGRIERDDWIKQATEFAKEAK